MKSSQDDDALTKNVPPASSRSDNSIASKADCVRAQPVQQSEKPQLLSYESSVISPIRKNKIKARPTETIPESLATQTPPHSNLVPERPLYWAPKRPGASRRLGLQDEDHEPAESNAVSTPPRPTQSAKRREMLLRAPKPSHRVAPALYAHEHDLGDTYHGANDGNSEEKPSSRGSRDQ